MRFVGSDFRRPSRTGTRARNTVTGMALAICLGPLAVLMAGMPPPTPLTAAIWAVDAGG
jgi:hypothetical protein